MAHAAWRGSRWRSRGFEKIADLVLDRGVLTAKTRGSQVSRAIIPHRYEARLWPGFRECLLMVYQRITFEAGCIRGLRIPVATVVAMVADGMTPQEILGAYPDLEPADIREALHFAAEAVLERQLPLQQAS